MAHKPARFGPGALVAAAFMGPGTVTVCTLAGVNDGYSLLWAMLVAILICYLLQEMTARLGLVSRQGLAEALRSQITIPIVRIAMLGIVLCAIVIGNAAYEAGNISGGALGLLALTDIDDTIRSDYSMNIFIVVVAVAAGLLLYSGSYRVIERTLVGLVILMSVSFALAATTTQPPTADLLVGFIPRMRPEQTLTVISLIGTTVVPYNFFLHAHIVQEKWSGAEDLSYMRRDSAITIAVGGMISMAVIISAASLQGSQITDAAGLAAALEPVFGPFARYIVATGLFAAGITSAITAPLAAVYVANGCLGWPQDLRAARSRAIVMVVLLAGVFFAVIGGSPIEIIRFAQIANGILLPLIVAFLLWVVNRKRLMGNYINSRLRNLLGIAVLVFVATLSARSIWLVLT